MNTSSLDLLSSIGNRLIEKIAGAIGIVYDPNGIRAANRTFAFEFANEVAHSNDLSPHDKLLLMSELNMAYTKSRNRTKIIYAAIPHLTETAEPENVSDNWLLFFFEKAGNVTDEDFQQIWARILATEANNPNTISRRLLHNLSLMSSSDAQNFLSLSRFCFYDRKQAINHAVIFMREYAQEYEQSHINTEILKELEQYSLIELNYESGFIVHNRIHLQYSNHRIDLTNHSANIPMGNVRLTADGQTLLHLILKGTDHDILSFTIDIWKSKSITVSTSVS